MKKIYLLIITILLMSVPIKVDATSNIIYSGNSKEFINISDDDIFSNFKNLMPGDKITEQIVIKNAASKEVKIKLYIRSLGATEETKEFLSQLNLTVNKINNTKLFKGPASETSKLNNWTYLGTIYSGGKVTLDITLEVPIQLSNAYQDKIGYVDWQFKVEELPISKDDPKNPSTLDNINTYIVLGSVSVIVLIILLIILLRKSNEKENETIE